MTEKDRDLTEEEVVSEPGTGESRTCGRVGV
jgi:hypothetical protein